MKATILWSLIAAGSILLNSCNKWLDLQPQDGITRAEFWKTKEDVHAALIGIYSSLNSGAVEQQLFTWGELRADLVALTTYASDDNRLVKNYNILSTNVIADWSAVYTAINNCNLLIDYAGQAKQADPTFSDAEYNTDLGEALAVRSFLYFYLVRTFRDIPLKLKGTAKDTDVVSVGQSSADEVLKQIEKDLLQALDWVPEYHVSSTVYNATNAGRVTRPAVRAMLADLYLWMEKYDKVEEQTSKILETGRYNLIGAALPELFDGGTMETILELSHKNSKENLLYNLGAIARRPYTANVDILNNEIFPANETVDIDLSDSRGEGILYGVSGDMRKYGTESPSYYNFQLYRISDVMLMRAEALAELGRGVEALTLIEDLRTKRKALQATNPNIEATDLDGIILFVFAERARELTFEGKRWFDLLRLAKKDNYANINVLVDLVTKVVDANVRQSAINKVRDVDSHYLPILETELFKDPRLKQNPFYLK
ncbi:MULTISPECIES: RagB/SusD family nutrient uptake outer membrane protein [unclassified Sphingobacterium]|uniref:RagB/SusD family nutrient uptake outer membrane protein n=1 Tax=unclassified Sphingobacterium TaxID=2609468 RepID=UPI0025E76AD1|nr:MULTISPECIES: RagB/SusD family nutrient uptake outer membrane protein [unclassified Sphingobacterium]